MEDYCGIIKNDNDSNSEENLKYIIIGTILMLLFPILVSITLFLFFKKKKKDSVQSPDEIINKSSSD